MQPDRETSVPLTLRISEYVISAHAAARALAEQAAIPPHFVTEMPCVYCTSPEGWDACPIHRDH